MAAPSAAPDNTRFLTAIIRASLGRPEGDDLAVLEEKLEGLQPTVGQAPKKAPPKAHAKPPAAATKGQGTGPDRDALGRRRNKPYGQQQGR